MNKRSKKLLMLALILMVMLGTVTAESVGTPSDLLLETPITTQEPAATPIESEESIQTPEAPVESQAPMITITPAPTIAPEITDSPTEQPTITYNPTPTPTQTQKPKSLKDKLNPNRTIDVHVEWDGGLLCFGDEVALVAVLNGYDNAIYTLQWQVSIDCINWVDIEGETNDRLHIIVTEENYLNYWRIVVTITDVITEYTE